MKVRTFTSAIGIVVVLASLWAGAAQAAVLPVMHVGRVEASYAAAGTGGYLISAAVTIHDMEHMPLPGAAVTVQWAEPQGIRVTEQTVTNWEGQAKFQINSSVPGTYQVCVTNVVRAGWVYDPRSNEQTCASIQVPRVICINGVCPTPAPTARVICIDAGCPTLHTGPVVG